MKKQLLIFLLGLLLVLTNKSIEMSAATYHLLTRYEPTSSSVCLKVLTPSLLITQGLFYERKEMPAGKWESLHEAPVFPGDYPIPEIHLQADERLSELVEIPFNIYKDPKLSGLLKAMFFSYAVWNNEYARFLGIAWLDQHVVAGSIYLYRVRSGSGDLLAVSDTVNAKPQSLEELPDSFRVSVHEEEVRMVWQPNPKKYYGVNIYRSIGSDSNWVRLNQQPFLATRVLQKDGNMGYPADFYQDRPDVFNEMIHYQIKPLDYFGHEFAVSFIQSVILLDTIPPKPPSFFRTSVNQYRVDLSWENPLDAERHGVHVYRARNNTEDFALLTSLSPHSTSFRDTVPRDGFFYYTVASVDKAGNEAHSTLSFADIPDVVPPEAPEHISIESDTGMIRLTWSAVQTDDLLGYRIYRTINRSDENTYVLLNATPQTDTFFVDYLPRIASNPFYYSVVAVDSSYNMSRHGMPVFAILPDVTAPDVPFIKNVQQKTDVVQIEWMPNVETDLAAYSLFRKREYEALEKVSSNLLPAYQIQYLDAPEEAGTYYYCLTAIDQTGNESDTSEPFPVLYREVHAETNQVINNIQIDQRREESHLHWRINQTAVIRGCVVFKEENGYFSPISDLLPSSPQYRFLIDSQENAAYFVRIYMVDGRNICSETVRAK